MYKNRPIVVATLGYIIGIIWGLYLKINIVFFYILAFIFLIVAKIISNFRKKTKKFKFISISKIFRYIKLILDFKSLIIIIIISSISNLIITTLNSKYENLYSNVQEVEATAKIVDNGTQKEYKTIYKIKVETLNNKDKYKDTFLYLEVSKNYNISLKYGDYIKLYGKYQKPSQATNYKAFDYSKYLRTEKIYGTIKLKNAQILKENSNNFLFTISNNIFIKIKNTIQNNLPEEKANLLLGILLGYKEEISKELQENFRESNISHILAVSGLHVSYIILVVVKILQRFESKRKAKQHTLFFILAYMFITNFSPTVVRAGIMSIIAILASLTYNKNDIWTSIAISLLIILIYNPYLITSAGVLLSYGGTIGIILFQRNISHMFQKIKARSKLYKYNVNEVNVKVINYIQETLSVSLSAQLIIAPIIAEMFNTASITFFVTNFFVSLLIGPIISIGFLFIILELFASGKSIFLAILSKVIKFLIPSKLISFSNLDKFINFLIPSKLISVSNLDKFINCLIPKNIIKFALEKLLELLILISKLGKTLPLNKIYVATPKMWYCIIYYVVILIFNIFYKIQNKRKITVFQKRLINWKNLIKHLARKKQKKILLVIVTTLMLILAIYVLPKDLKIYFIDVGQGDSTLIITPHNQTILIDGGGSETYDVGKNILIPYLLDRGITKIDYAIISHFDTDHVGGVLSVTKELKVKNIIMSKQPENSDNFQELCKIVKQKNINIIIVNKGNQVTIENDIYLNMLWPDTSNFISENALNNNSLVCKFCYKNFSMLFTGDIEKIAEEQILKEYENTKNEIKKEQEKSKYEIKKEQEDTQDKIAKDSEASQHLNSVILKIAHHRFKNVIYQEIYRSGKTQNCINRCWKKQYFWTSK